VLWRCWSCIGRVSLLVMSIFHPVRQVAAPGAKSAFSDCILLIVLTVIYWRWLKSSWGVYKSVTICVNIICMRFTQLEVGLMLLIVCQIFPLFVEILFNLTEWVKYLAAAACGTYASRCTTVRQMYRCTDHRTSHSFPGKVKLYLKRTYLNVWTYSILKVVSGKTGCIGSAGSLAKPVHDYVLV